MPPELEPPEPIDPIAVNSLWLSLPSLFLSICRKRSAADILLAEPLVAEPLVAEPLLVAPPLIEPLLLAPPMDMAEYSSMLNEPSLFLSSFLNCAAISEEDMPDIVGPLWLALPLPLIEPPVVECSSLREEPEVVSVGPLLERLLPVGLLPVGLVPEGVLPVVLCANATPALAVSTAKEIHLTIILVIS